MTCSVRLLTLDEHATKEAARMAAIEADRAAHPEEPYRLQPEFYRSNWFAPGDAFYCPWYFDPANPDPSRGVELRARALELIAEGKKPAFLSAHYWRDWSDKRAPINVFLPNGDEWLIDQVSTSDGPESGWRVTIDAAGAITCSPSIDVKGRYHGHLTGGRFTASLDGLPPDGRRRVAAMA